MAKSAEAFRTISEVADWLGLPTHVLRFWESKFTQVKPVKRAGGRRYYRPNDMMLLGGIKKLLHDDGMTIKGAQKMLREYGVKHVAALSQPLEQDPESETAIEAEAQDASKTLESPDSSPPSPDTEPSEEPEAAPPSVDPDEVERDAAEMAGDDAAENRSGDEPADAPAPDSDTPRDAPREADVEDTPEPGDVDATQEGEPASSYIDTAALPSFLRKPGESTEGGDGAESKSRRLSLSVDVPRDPADADPDVDAGLLSRLAALRSPLDEDARHALERARDELRNLSQK